MLNIYYGRENIDKEKFIFDNINGKTLLLVPDQFTLQAERNAFYYLGVNSLINVEAVSLSRLGQRILKETGGEKAARIDKYGRHMLLSKIINEEKDSLEIFRDMRGKASFTELVNNLISEMKQHNTGTGELADIIAGLENGSILKSKLEDILKIYVKYEKAVESTYIDSEDHVEFCIKKVKDSAWIKENEIWVYGFDYFTPKNLKFIGELIDNAVNVNVVMTCSDDERDREIFELTGGIIRKLERISEGLSKSYRTMPINDEYIQKKKGNGEISFIEQELYAIPSGKWTESQENESVTMVKAANPYAEAETAGAYILKLVREKNMRYKDIAVICNDLDVRGNIIRRVFREYGLNVFMDRKRNIVHNPVISLILYLMQMAMGRMDVETVIGFMKTGFAGIDKDMTEELENYAIKYKIRGGMWSKPFARGQKEYTPEAFLALNEARESLVNTVNAFAEPVKKADTAGEKTAVLYYFLKDYLHLPERLEEIIEIQNAGGQFELSFEMSQVWKTAVEILDQIAVVMGEEPMDLRELDRIMRAGFESVELGMLPATIDEIMVGTMQRTRAGRIKALVVIGANDGILPSSPSGDGILNDDEKNILYKHNAEICKLDELRAAEEKLALYRNLSSPEEYLFMSCSVSDTEGKELKPSAVFTKLADLFPQVKTRKDIISDGHPVPLLSSEGSGLKHLSEALRNQREGRKEEEQELSDCWKAALAWYKQNEEEHINLIEKGLFFSIKNKKMSKKEAEALYKRDESLPLSLSPSRLERFGRCPFAHFVTYGLKPEERRVFEIAGREMGDIYHLCLMRLSQHLTENGVDITDKNSRWMKITPQECGEFVERFIDSEAAEYREGLLKGGKAESYKAERIKRVCTDAAVILVEHVQKGRIKNILFEAGFGRSSGRSFPAIEVETSAGTVLVEGKIDRADILPGDFVKIIDYKSGAEKFDMAEAKGGWRLQLMLYLKATLGEGEKKPAGVFYFKVDEPLVNASGMQTEKLSSRVTEEIKKTFRLDGIMVDDPQVIENIAGDFDGSSDVVPLKKNKSGEIQSAGKDRLLSPEEFAEFEKEFQHKINELCEALAMGSTAVSPGRSGEETACRYCMYKSICKFDTAFEGCSYRNVKKELTNV